MIVRGYIEQSVAERRSKFQFMIGGLPTDGVKHKGLALYHTWCKGEL